ncbi:MAG: hypothetical protein ACRDTA_04825 [Pseudonocardiaceae bacterium]
MRRWRKGYAAWWCGTLRTVDRDGTIKLLAVILADLPKLDGAACRGRHELFDPMSASPRPPRRSPPPAPPAVPP